MNLLDILTISPYYFYKCVGATNENLNFDIVFKGLTITISVNDFLQFLFISNKLN